MISSARDSAQQGVIAMYSVAYPMGVNDITDDTIFDMVDAAIHLGLDRRALLSGVPASITAQLPDMPRPNEQILSDLMELRGMGTLPGGVTPLRVWLRNAKQLSALRVEARVFEAALRALEGAPAPMDASANSSAMTSNAAAMSAPAMHGSTTPAAPSPTLSAAPASTEAAAPTATKSAPAHEPIDILILTVIPEEYAAVNAVLENAAQVDGTADDPNLYGYRIGSISRASGGRYRVVLALVGAAGNVNAGLATVTSARRWKPRYAVVAGIAGGLPREQCTVGDVVVSTEIYGYEYGSLDGGFKPRPNWIYQVDRGLSNSAQAHAAVHEDVWSGAPWPAGKAPESLPKVLFGPVASGNKLVDDPTEPSFKAVLDHWPKLQAIEMEGAGAAAAIEELHAQGQSIGWLMVRGISDMPKAPADRPAQGAQSAERNANKKLASATCARFLQTWIQHAWPVAPKDAQPGPR